MQEETTEKRRAERAEAFVAPVETAEPTVEEKRKRKRKTAETGEGAMPVEGNRMESPDLSKRERKEKKKRKKSDAGEDVEAER